MDTTKSNLVNYWVFLGFLTGLWLQSHYWCMSISKAAVAAQEIWKPGAHCTTCRQLSMLEGMSFGVSSAGLNLSEVAVCCLSLPGSAARLYLFLCCRSESDSQEALGE